MISTFRNLFVRIKWDGSLSKCLVHNYYYTTLFCRLCFEMKSAPQWDVTKYSIKKESSQLVGKDLGKSIQYCRDSAASGMNSEGTSKGILHTRFGEKSGVHWETTFWCPNLNLYLVLCTAGSSWLGKVINCHLCSQSESQPLSHPSFHPCIHPSIDLPICPSSCLSIHFLFLSINLLCKQWRDSRQILR